MRPRVLLNRCGLGIAILLASSWLISRWRGFYWCGADGTDTYRVELASGRLRLAHDYNTPGTFIRGVPGAWTSGWVFVPTSPDATRLWLWNFHSQNTPGFRQVFIPLWAMFAIPALPLATAELLRRRALKRAHNPHPCPHCDYNLTGLAPGAPCPECGKSSGAPRA